MSTKKFAGLDSLQAFLNGCKTIFANITHSHTTSEITDLQEKLDKKSNSGHNHSAAAITTGTLSSSRIPTISVEKGGTGATTVEDARTSLSVYSINEIDAKLSEKADSEHSHGDLYDAKGDANTALEFAKAYTDESVANKQDKNLIVRVVDANARTASHTPSEVMEYFQSGGKVIFFDGGTEHAFLEGYNNTSIFYYSYVGTNKIQATVVELLSDKTFTLERYSYAPTGAVSTITSSNLTANRALISNGSGKVAISAVTSTELGYLDGVTSAIQGQLDSKVPSTRTINNKALSDNITISASDIGAYSKTDIDSMEFITVSDIDTICGATIQVVDLDDEVKF